VFSASQKITNHKKMRQYQNGEEFHNFKEKTKKATHRWVAFFDNCVTA
jgi:hypothetical protein